MAGRRKGGQRGEEFKQEDVLQAIVIADSFNTRFAPITKDKPRALLPLVNAPLLDYTLESLGAAGIEQVVIFCCAHSQQIKDHISKSQWSSETSPMEIMVLTSETCMSMGDALRDIDARSIISSDFVLVSGDMVSNVKLKPIIEQHKARRLKEKTPIMTIIAKRAPPGHNTRCKEDEVVLAIKPESNRILSYQKVGSSKKLNIQLELLEENPTLELRYDLLDCHMSVCSPTVPQLFTDNFDYLTREDFIKGILVNEEILGNTIHVHELEEEYAARVSNLFMYESISQDVMSRWTYPIVPDMCTATGETYRHRRHNIYLHEDVTLARGCELKEKVVIGRGSAIGSNTRVSKSVIGKNCKIGKNVTLEGAYVWDDVIVEDGSSIYRAVLDNDVTIKQSVTVPEGCVISNKVTIGPNVALEPCTLVVSSPSVDDFGDELPTEKLDLGTDGIGFRYQAPAESDDEDLDDLIQDVWGMRLESEEEADLSSGESDFGEESESGGSPPPEDWKQFYDEVLGTLERALAENISNDNLVLEINSLKSAYGLVIQEVNIYLTKAILELPLHMDSSLDQKGYFPKIKQNFRNFLPLLRNYIRNVQSQKDLIGSFEETCAANEIILSTAAKLVHYLYEADLLGEDVILDWYSNLNTEDDQSRTKLHTSVAPLVKWLEEAESDSEEDDD